jgi:hypothetical protein
MTKYSKYLSTFFFAIAILSVIDFMISYNTLPRYQYSDFEFGAAYRTIASLLLLGSLIYLLMQEWSYTPNKRLYTIASIIYTGIILVDIQVWLWMAHWSWLYYYITLIHTLPIFAILSKLKMNIKSKYLFFLGSTILLLGFLFDAAFIHILSTDMTDDLYEQTIRLEKTRNIIYYFGFITIVFGIITLVKKIKLKKTAA